MTRRTLEVGGDLSLQGPGVPPLPMRIDGSPALVRVRIPRRAAAAAAAPALGLLRALAALTPRRTRVVLMAGRWPLLEVGGPRGRLRVRPLGALVTLLATPVSRLPSLLRALRAARPRRASRGGDPGRVPRRRHAHG